MCTFIIYGPVNHLRYAISGLISKLQASSLLPEYYLRKELFKTYNPKVFPAPAYDQSLDIQVGVSLLSIDSVVSDLIIFQNNCSLKMLWKLLCIPTGKQAGISKIH